VPRVPSYRPDLPDFGVYIHWPAPGFSWIHPHDIALAAQLIPSRRVFQRVRFDDTYYHLRYGRKLIRVRPTLWTRMPMTDVLVGDRIELSSQFGRNDPGLACVVDVLANRQRDGFEYVLRRGEMVLPKSFRRDEFRLLSVRHRLRSGYYAHPAAQYSPPADLERLDVGDLS
jgi:hypothetical protein